LVQTIKYKESRGLGNVKDEEVVLKRQDLIDKAKAEQERRKNGDSPSPKRTGSPSPTKI